MKEHPILFNAFSVRALRAGRKTQTRRPITPQPERWDTIEHKPCLQLHNTWSTWSPLANRSEDRVCPYAVGDRLWVKETCIPREDRAIYRADVDPVEAAELSGMYGGWTPSIFMQRRHSRITVLVTLVRVERVQEISVEDCIAEGCSTNLREQDACVELRDQYHAVWDSIHAPKGAEGWKANPWVWAYSFAMEEVRNEASEKDSVRG